MGHATPQPRWLSDAEQQTWRGFLAVERLLFEALDRQLQAEADMPHGYYILLAMLSEAPGRALRMSELAELSQSSQSRVSMVSLSSRELSLIDLSTLARWKIRPRLMGVPGVANVTIWGQRDRQFQVLVDPVRRFHAPLRPMTHSPATLI